MTLCRGGGGFQLKRHRFGKVSDALNFDHYDDGDDDDDDDHNHDDGDGDDDDDHNDDDDNDETAEEGG